MLSAEETRPERSLSSCWNIDLSQKRKIVLKENPFIHFCSFRVRVNMMLREKQRKKEEEEEKEEGRKRERGTEKKRKREREKERKNRARKSLNKYQY